MHDDEEEGGFDLVMPFVVCQSQGGPYDDESFTAGWNACLVDAGLDNMFLIEADYWVQTALVPQIDLIAMRRDCKMTILDTQGDMTQVHCERL